MSQVNQSSSYNSVYRSEVDGLRAFAVLSVVAFHAFPSWLKGGFIGVDVFFVISGFLITSHIFENLNKGQFSFADFFGRRIRRIFPALILVMACSLAFGWFALLPDEFAQLGKHVASGVAFITNFILVDESGYFDNATETKPMLHLWSLAVEEQFYIVWPFVLWLAWKSKFNLLTITILVAVLSFYLNLRFVRSYPTETFFWPIGRFWELLSGSILAWLLLYKSEALSQIKLRFDKFLVRVIRSEEVEVDGSTTSNMMSLFGLSLLAYGVIRIDENFPFPSQWALIPVLGAVFVIASGSKAWLNRVFLMNPIAVWFGLISYPLYLWHWPVLSFLQIITGEMPHRNARILAVLISIFLAFVTYRFIERRVRNGRRNRFKALMLIILILPIGFSGWHVSKNGLDSRQWVVNQSLIIEDLKYEFFQSAIRPSICGQLTKVDGKSVCGSTREQPKTVLLGDSHAPPLFYGLSKLYEELDRGVAVLGGGGGCPPLYGVISIDGPTDRNCLEKISDTVDVIANTDFIEEVMLVSRGPLYTSESVGFGDIDHKTPFVLTIIGENEKLRSNEEVFRLGLKNTLDKFLGANKKVVYVFDVPELGFFSKSCISERYYFPSKDIRNPCSLDKKLYLARIGAFKSLVNDVLSGYPMVRVIDLSNAICESDNCFGGKNGRLYYMDDDHLSRHGAEYVVESLRKDFVSLYD